jgi:hypothetical protein
MPLRKTSTFSKPGKPSMKKASHWGKHLLLPAVTTLVLFGAGSAVTTAKIGSPTSTGVSLSSSLSGASDSPTALEAFCERSWGELSSDGEVCRFTQRFHLNLSHVGGGLALTNIPLVPQDTLSLEATNPPDVVVGNDTYGTGGDTLRLASSGYLSFRVAEGQTLFSVQRVTLERCYAAIAGALSSVACPAR